MNPLAFITVLQTDRPLPPTAPCQHFQREARLHIAVPFPVSAVFEELLAFEGYLHSVDSSKCLFQGVQDG